MFVPRMQLIHNDLNARILSSYRGQGLHVHAGPVQEIISVIHSESALNPGIGISFECAGRGKSGVEERTCHSPSEEVVGVLSLPATLLSIFRDMISAPAIL